MRSLTCVSVVVCVASYARVQATVGVGTVLIWDFGVAYTRGGGVISPFLSWGGLQNRNEAKKAKRLHNLCLLWAGKVGQKQNGYLPRAFYMAAKLGGNKNGCTTPCS